MYIFHSWTLFMLYVCWMFVNVCQCRQEIANYRFNASFTKHKTFLVTISINGKYVVRNLESKSNLEIKPQQQINLISN